MYELIISHKHKFIFIKTRKTAGTSVEIELSRHCGRSDVITPTTTDDEEKRKKLGGKGPQNYYFSPYEIQNILRIGIPKLLKKRRLKDFLFFIKRGGMFYKYWEHSSANYVKNMIDKEIWDNYFKFCFERNPWDKAVSQYYWRRRRYPNLSFEDYIKRFNCINYPLYMDTNHKNIIVDYVGYYENLNEELNYIFNKIGIPFDGKLKPKAKSGIRKDKKSYHEFFSGNYEKYIDVIRKVYKKEIELHGYDFQNLES